MSISGTGKNFVFLLKCNDSFTYLSIGFVYVCVYACRIVSPYPSGIHSQTPSGGLKMQIVPNTIYNMLFSYTNIPMINFSL